MGSWPALRLLALVGASLWLTLAPVPASAAPAHLGWAEEIALNVSPPDNEYASDPSYIHWPGVQGATTYANRTKCASFVTLVLRQAYGWGEDDFDDWLDSPSPFAAAYHDAILTGTDFLEIQTITDIQGGDIIAIKYPVTPNPDDDTGHVMIAAGPPTWRKATTPVVAGTTQYAIEVLDSTKTPHGATDTRKATGDTGAGSGVFRLYANTAGTIVGYTWSPEDQDYYAQRAPSSQLRHLTVGRLQHR